MALKGTLIHEILSLPMFWLKCTQVDSAGLNSTKHKYGKHRNQYIIEFTSDKSTRAPVILYFHGGGWRHGKPEMFKANAKLFNELGYAVFMPSYRRIPMYNSDDIRADLQNAIAELATILKQRGQENRDIILGGMSAGGHLAALIAADHQRLFQPAFKLEQLKALMLFAPPANLAKMPKTLYLKWLAGKQGSTQFHDANPYSFIKEQVKIPTLLFHGTSDGIVPYPAGQTYAEQLQKLHPKHVEFHTIKDGTHLDAVSWVYQEGKLRTILIKWLDQF